MQNSGSKRRNRGFAGNRTAPAMAWGRFMAAKHPYGRAGLPFLGRERRNCSSSMPKGCSHQVLRRPKPRSDAASPAQSWPRVLPSPVSTAQSDDAASPLHQLGHPRDITSRGKIPTLTLNEPRGSPKTFTRCTAAVKPRQLLCPCCSCC